jgi:S1-C subfamily serine protease
MKLKTAPTSPKYPLEQQTEQLKQVWQQPNIQAPARIPLLSLLIWCLVFSLLSLVLLIGGAAWYLKLHPGSPLKSYFPSTVTTVIQNGTEQTTAATPKNVSSAQDRVIPLAVNPGKDGIVTESQVTGVGVAISSAGWVMTVSGALPTGSSIVGLASDRTLINFTNTVKDPASALVFLPTDATNLKPVDFAEPQSLVAGQTIWVLVQRISSGLAVHRQLLPIPLGWQSGDRVAPQWMLDEPVNAPLGSPVVNDRGQLIGLLGEQSKIWPTSGLDAVLSALLADQPINRPACGFSYTWLNRTVYAGHNTAVGYLIGAASGTAAIQANSPAATAGLKAGDIITTVDGVQVDNNWTSIWSNVKIGQTLRLTIKRGTSEKTINLKTGILK